MNRKSHFNRFPFIPVTASASDCVIGWDSILEVFRGATGGCRRHVFCVECYLGVVENELVEVLGSGLRPGLLFRTNEYLKSPREIDQMLARDLGEDPVFGRMNGVLLNDFFDTALAAAREQIAKLKEGLILIIGTGATLLAPEPDILVYADLSRWEIQRRQRRSEIGNLGADNRDEKPSLKYKRAFFVDWRAADRTKKALLSRIDFLLDTNDRRAPKLISGEMLRRGLKAAVKRPFSVVPFFDPGPWGGQWMKRAFQLPDDVPNYAWCFNCVPEENSLLLGFGDARVEIPALDLVFSHARELLGEAVHGRFGMEFPIRFDFLDTMEGGNLSLQVHPLTEYIQDRFGVHYTQDESYYILEAGEGAAVYLGLKEGIRPAAMLEELQLACESGCAFPVEKYINTWPARKHDHFLIPAGTVHCSGCNNLVLEISATPYIFTFKLWDWGRVGLDGLPRPIHLEHGRANLRGDRTTSWVQRELVNRIEVVAQGEGWCEERTGLHQREFIETRRHWFRGPVDHHTGGGVNVLNLVGGDEALVESPSQDFEPFVVHYAETFIVPASVGAYTVRPWGVSEGRRCVTIKAYVRTNP